MSTMASTSTSRFEDGMHDIRSEGLRWLMLDYHLRERVLVIDLISVDQPRQGLGSDVMRSIVDLADQHDVVIEVEASSHGGRNIRQRKLEKWYGRFGFEPTGTRSSEGNPMMRREPRAAIA